MRTTLTIDEDVAAKLKAKARLSGEPFKQVVNRILRQGLTAAPAGKSKRKVVIRAKNLGIFPGLDYDNIHKLLEQIEGPFHR